MAACLAGSVAAWKRLLARYEAVIHAIPRRYGLGAEDAAEVFQNVCLALYRGLPRLKLAAGLTRWVLVTTRRQARDLAAKRRREVLDGESDRILESPDSNPRIDEILEEMEGRVALHRGIDSLNERCAQLLRWLYLDKEPLSYREVARRLGIPEGTVGPTRARCLARLRRILDSRRETGTK